MRSYDRAMPEELNRVLADHAADLLLCSSERAAENLRAEGVRGEIDVVGDVMVDVALLLGPRARERTEVLERYGVEPGAFVLITVHRAGNVDDPARLERLVELLEALPMPAVLPLHPRTARRLEADRPARARSRPPCGWCRRSATWTSPRCCSTRGLC